MHGKESRVHALLFGFDLLNFYVRLDFRLPEGPPKAGESVVLYILSPVSVRVTCTLEVSGIEGRMERQVNDEWETIHNECQTALGSVFELAVPWSGLQGIEPGKEFEFVLSLQKGEREIERIPSRSTLSTICPDENFDELMWSV